MHYETLSEISLSDSEPEMTNLIALLIPRFQIILDHELHLN